MPCDHIKSEMLPTPAIKLPYNRKKKNCSALGVTAQCIGEPFTISSAHFHALLHLNAHILEYIATTQV